MPAWAGQRATPAEHGAFGDADDASAGAELGARPEGAPCAELDRRAGRHVEHHAAAQRSAGAYVDATTGSCATGAQPAMSPVGGGSAGGVGAGR